MGSKLQYPYWLVPIDGAAKRRNTRWICACNHCQCEREVSYAQAFNILTGASRRECRRCQEELGIITYNTIGFVEGRTEENQKKAAASRIGKKRPKAAIVLDYIRLFNPTALVTEDGREKQRKAKLGKYGELANHWEGGKTAQRQAEMCRDQYRQLRMAVFERDDYTCRECLRRGGQLEMHHIRAWANYIETRYDPDNCITLCHACHAKTDNYLHRARKGRE